MRRSSRPLSTKPARRRPRFSCAYGAIVDSEGQLAHAGAAVDAELDWFVLASSEYARTQPDGDGVIRSHGFPGLWLQVDKLVERDFAPVLTRLAEGMATPEYRAFRDSLRA